MSDADTALEVAEKALKKARKEVGKDHDNAERAAHERAREAVVAEYGAVSQEAAAALYLLAESLMDSEPEPEPALWLELLEIEQQVYGPLPHEETVGTVSNLARAYMKLSQDDEAEMLFRWACGLEPDDATNTYNLGQHLTEGYQQEQAIQYHLHRIALGEGEDPLSLGESNLSLGDTFDEMGRIREAHSCYKASVKLFHDNEAPEREAVALYHYADYMFKQGEWKAAAEAFKKDLVLEIEEVDAPDTLSTSLSSMAELVPELSDRGQVAEAKKIYKLIMNALEESLPHPERYRSHLMAYGLAIPLCEGKTKLAGEQLQAACEGAKKLNPGDYEEFYRAAEGMLRRWGAIELVEPFSEFVLDRIGRMRRDGRAERFESFCDCIDHWPLPDLRLKAWRHVVENGRDPEYLVRLASLLVENGLYEEALEIIHSDKRKLRDEEYQADLRVAAARIAAEQGDLEALKELLATLEKAIPEVEESVPDKKPSIDTTTDHENETEFDAGQEVAEQAVAAARKRVGKGVSDPERAAIEMAREEIYAKYGQVSREAAGLLFLLADHLGGLAEGLPVWFELLAVEQQVFGPIPHEQTLGTISNLALHYRSLEMYHEAEMLNRWAAALDPEPWCSMWNLGRMFHEQAEYEQTSRQMEKIVAMGDAPPQAEQGQARATLGSCLGELKRYAEAKQLLPAGNALLAKSDDHYEYGVALHHYGFFLREIGEYDAAVPPLKKSIALREEYEGSGEGLDTSLEVLGSLVPAYCRRGKIKKGEKLYAYLREIYDRTEHEDLREVSTFLVLELELQLARGEEAAAKKTLQRVLKFAAKQEKEVFQKIVEAAHNILLYWGAENLASMLLEHCNAWVEKLEDLEEDELEDVTMMMEDLLRPWSLPASKATFYEYLCQRTPSGMRGIELAKAQIDLGKFAEAAATLENLPRGEDEDEYDVEESQEQRQRLLTRIAADQGDVPALIAYLAELKEKEEGEEEE